MQNNAIRNRLLKSPVTKERKLTLNDGISEPVLADMKDVKAVMKNLYQTHEAGAYILSDYMGLDIVPVTIMRKHNSRIKGEENYSFQYFIKDSKTLDETVEKRKKLESVLEQIKIIRVFDYLLANIDRHEANLLLDKDNKVWAIDNGYAFWTNQVLHLEDDENYSDRCYNFKEVIEVIRQDIKLYDAIKKIRKNKYYVTSRLKTYFGKDDIKQMFKRVDKIINAYSINNHC